MKGLPMRAKSYKQTLANNRSAGRYYAAMAGLPANQMDIEPVPAALKPKKTGLVRNDPLEKDIQKDIISMLRIHPRVALVEAHNSGAAYMPGKNGEEFPMWFNHIYMKGLRMPDVHATLKGGARRLVIEVKRPPWTKPRDDREREQAKYLEVINDAGGIGIFATCVEDVIDALESAFNFVE
jgi:hypothetical protein